MSPRTTIIGRQNEKGLIQDAIGQSLDSRGQVIFVSGEAGIGKSTIANHLEDTALEKGMRVFKGECTYQDSGVPYQGFQRALSELAQEELFSLEDFAYFDEVFLISNIGLLISHVSGSKDESIDEDILGSMLTAVQDFVKDSFGGGGDEEQKGGLGKLEYLNTKITIEHGDLVYLAVVTSGHEHPDMKKDIKKCLGNIEERYFDLLMDWDGDLDSLSGSVDMLEELVEKRYRIKRSLENINIESERLKVQNRILEMVETHASGSGLCLILEDIHWADESTILALPFLARNIIENNVLLALTYRTEGLEKYESLHNMVDELSDMNNCNGIRLHNLDEANQYDLVSSILGGGKPPEELMVKLNSETVGNPFFITETIRALTSEGTVYRDKDVWVMKHGKESRIPHSVTELVSRRLENLELENYRILEYGAVLGKIFSKELLSMGFPMSEEHLAMRLSELVDTNLLSFHGDNELIFQQSKVQEAIYTEIGGRGRRMLHKNAGVNIERTLVDNLDDGLFSLAYHFSRTREYEKGIEYSISAGYKARNNFAPREAADYFQTAIKLIDDIQKDEPRYLTLNEILGELFELDGNYSSAMEVYDMVLEKSHDPELSASTLMKKGRVLQSQGNYDDAISTFQKGIDLLKDSGSTPLTAKINGYMGKVYLRKGESEKSLEMQTNYLKKSEEIGDDQEIGQAHMNLGGLYYYSGDLNMATNHWKKAMECFEKAGYLQGVAFINDNLGVVNDRLGQFSEALEYYKKSEEIMKKTGDVKGMSSVLLNIGAMYYRMGKYEKSLDYYNKSLQLKKKIGDTIGTATIYNNLGATYLDMGEFDKASSYFKNNLKLRENVGDKWGISRALNNIASAEIENGNHGKALECLEKSLDIGLEKSYTDISAYSYLFQGRISSHQKDYTSADELFKKGLEFAKKTEDPEIIGQAYLFIARHLARKGEIEKAVDKYSQSFSVFEKSNLESNAKKAREEMQKYVDS